jgi:ABC-type hemin transport system substrate-binding protein
VAEHETGAGIGGTKKLAAGGILVMRPQQVIHLSLAAIAVLLGALSLMIPGLAGVAVPAAILAAVSLGMDLVS